MKKITIFILVLCLAFPLTACKNRNTDNTSSKKPVNASAAVGTFDNVSSEEDISKPIKPSKADVEHFLETDKSIAVSGELSDQRYSADISALENILKNYSHNISLAVYSVDGAKGLAFNTNAEIFGACTVKAAYTLYACIQMENGNGDLNSTMSYEQKHYESGTGDMQYSPFGTVFTMETALNKSMSISDNVGYLMSVDYFGRDGYNKFVTDLDCPSLVIKPTVWSLRTKANDLVKIWCEIYDYFETDSKYARFLYNSCTNTSGNYATAAIDGIDYSHKQGHNSTGEWLSLSDAGIVWKGDTPYVIAILTDAPGPSSYDADVFADIIDIVHNKLF